MPNILFVYLALVQVCFGHYWFRDRIPNGHNVLNPRADPNDPDTTIWRGVGHEARGGGGPRNVFGLAFKANNFVSKDVFLSGFFWLLLFWLLVSVIKQFGIASIGYHFSQKLKLWSDHCSFLIKFSFITLLLAYTPL